MESAAAAGVLGRADGGGAGDSGLRGTGHSPSAPPPSSSLPKTTLAACTVDGLTGECGNVWVPQDWAHPAGPAMPLQVVVLPATASSRPAAPLFYLAGWGGDGIGGGDSVFNGLDWAAQAFAQLNRTMDLVFVEQRGTTGSGLQTCPGLENWLASPAAIQAAARRAGTRATTPPPRQSSTWTKFARRSGITRSTSTACPTA